MNKLPMGWVKTPISTIFNPKQYKTVSTENLLNEGYTVYGANGKIGKYSEYTHEFPTIMVTCRGATCGNIHISEPYSYINGNAMALDCFVNPIYMNLKYWYYFFQFRKFNDVITGSAQPQITATNLKNIELFLAPKAEQDHIATLLDNHLSQVATISQKLNDILPIIKQFRQSVLAQAVSGKLIGLQNIEVISDGDLSYPIHWTKTTLGKAVHYGKTTKKNPDDIDGNEWVLELEDIEKDTSKILSRSYNNERQSKSTKNVFKKGDVLYGKLRPYLNKVVIADNDGVCTTEIIPISPNKDILSYYLFIWLKSPFFINYVNQITYGVNMPRLGTVDGKNAPILLPPLTEQQQIVTEVERLFAVADSIEIQVKEALERVGHLTQSILHQAFTGNLSADWRACNADLITGEHSATALLAQIKQAEPKSPRKKKAQ